MVWLRSPPLIPWISPAGTLASHGFASPVAAPAIRLNGSEDGLGGADEVLQGAVALGSEDQPMASGGGWWCTMTGLALLRIGGTGETTSVLGDYY